MTPEEIIGLKTGERVDFAPDGELHSSGVVEETAEAAMRRTGVFAAMIRWDDDHRSMVLADGRGTLHLSIRRSK